MEQYKLKKVMKLTQMWIQDNQYSNHAKEMKHSQWMKVLPIQSRDVWKFEADFIMNDNDILVRYGSWKLRTISNIGRRRFQGDSVTSYMLTPMGTFSTQDEMESEDQDR